MWLQITHRHTSRVILWVLVWQVPPPVVPASQPLEYYSSGTESESVMCTAPQQWQDPVMAQITDTVVPSIRRQSASSMENNAANVECTGIHPLVCPSTCQVSQSFAAEARAGAAHPTSIRDRICGYPAELHADYARVSAPPQEFCSRPADLGAGYARQAAQAECYRGQTTGIPAGCVSIPTPTEYMDPFLDHIPQRFLYDRIDGQRECCST